MTTSQPAAPAGDPGQGDPETGRIQSIQELSARQDRMDGKLDQLLSRFGIGDGGQGVAPAQQPAQQQPPNDPGARPALMQDQMRQAIRDVNAEQAAAAAKAQSQQQQPPAEQSPREVTLRGKERLQRWLFGCHT